MSDTPRTNAYAANRMRLPDDIWDLARELERENAALKEQWKEVEGRLMNDIAELRADAERYRWLRESEDFGIHFEYGDNLKWLDDPAELDAAIDARRGNERPCESEEAVKALDYGKKA